MIARSSGILLAALFVLPALTHAATEEDARLYAKSRCLSLGFEAGSARLAGCERAQMQKHRAAFLALSDADICKAVMAVQPAANYADTRFNIARCSGNPRAYRQRDIRAQR